MYSGEKDKFTTLFDISILVRFIMLNTTQLQKGAQLLSVTDSII